MCLSFWFVREFAIIFQVSQYPSQLLITTTWYVTSSKMMEASRSYEIMPSRIINNEDQENKSNNDSMTTAVQNKHVIEQAHDATRRPTTVSFILDSKGAIHLSTEGVLCGVDK